MRQSEAVRLTREGLERLLPDRPEVALLFFEQMKPRLTPEELEEVQRWAAERSRMELGRAEDHVDAGLEALGVEDDPEARRIADRALYRTVGRAREDFARNTRPSRRRRPLRDLLVGAVCWLQALLAYLPGFGRRRNP